MTEYGVESFSSHDDYRETKFVQSKMIVINEERRWKAYSVNNL